MKFEELTHRIIGCAMKVHSVLESGFQEVIYQRAIPITKTIKMTILKSFNPPLTGRLLRTSYTDKLYGQVINLNSDKNGTYIMKFNSFSGELIVKKFVIIK